MSYYGVSVLIIILVTSLTAFYLLYKAKELNLGILISISLGSLILGFSFVPLFKLMYGILSENISLNNPFTLVITLLIEFFAFLLFVCMISIIISISIPKKIISVDCCAVIDKFRDNISKNKSGNGVNVDNSVNATIMLKKFVDTNQIIDTMGIEKGENSKNDEIYASIEGNCPISKEPFPILEFQSDRGATSGIIAEQSPEAVEEHIELFEENGPEAVEEHTGLREENGPEAVEEHIELFKENGPKAVEEHTGLFEENGSEAVVEYVELFEEISSEAVEEYIESVEEKSSETVDEYIVSGEENNAELVQEYGVEAVETVAAVKEADLNESEIPETRQDSLNTDEAIGSIKAEMQRDNISDNGAATEYIEEPDAQLFIIKAFESKKSGAKDKAIQYYMEALEHQPDSNMIFWIVLDICAIYKQMGLAALAVSILEEVVNKYNSIIQPEVKAEILNNLK